MAAIKKAYFDAPDGQLHYRYLLTTQDAKKPPCVFLHMSASSSRHYESMMKVHADKGHDCYAPDMPGFGNSYDPETQPPNTGYYVDVFVKLFQSLGLSKFHIMGHHSGASLATEIAATYPSSVLILCLIGTVIMTRAEQIEMNSIANVAFNKPVQDGSHLIKTWDYLGKSGLGGDLAYKQLELIDHIRAWHGKTQIYTCVFEQDMWGLFQKLKCPILVMCARDDVLWPYVHYIHEIRPDVRFEEVTGGDFETGRPDTFGKVAEFHFDFLGGI